MPEPQIFNLAEVESAIAATANSPATCITSPQPLPPTISPSKPPTAALALARGSPTSNWQAAAAEPTPGTRPLAPASTSPPWLRRPSPCNRLSPSRCVSPLPSSPPSSRSPASAARMRSTSAGRTTSCSTAGSAAASSSTPPPIQRHRRSLQPSATRSSASASTSTKPPSRLSSTPSRHPSAANCQADP